MSTATLPSGQKIKVVGAGGQTHIMKSQTGGMVVQGAGGQQIVQQGLKMVTSKSGSTTAMIGGQTVRLASPWGTLLKPGTAIKTSQGMQVATMPNGQQQVVAGQGQGIVQAGPGKQIPQGSTIVKLVNAQGQPGN